MNLGAVDIIGISAGIGVIFGSTKFGRKVMKGVEDYITEKN